MSVNSSCASPPLEALPCILCWRIKVLLSGEGDVSQTLGGGAARSLAEQQCWSSTCSVSHLLGTWDPECVGETQAVSPKGAPLGTCPVRLLKEGPT